MTVSDELQRMSKEAVVAYCRLLYQHSPGRSKGNHKEPQSTWQVSWKRLETGPLEYEAGVPNNRLWSSVIQFQTITLWMGLNKNFCEDLITSHLYIQCHKNKYIKLDGVSYGPKQLRELIQIWVRKCCSNELEPFEVVPAAGGLEVWLRNQRTLRKILQENGDQGGWGVLVYTPSFIQFCSVIQKILRGIHRHTQRHIYRMKTS
jgi:hypothetical protein